MNFVIHHGDCLDVLRGMADNSVDLIATDPPYFRVKAEAWDRAWDKPEGFLAWIGELADEWRRVLKPNGSLYCFASPQMAARVEVTLGERFNVLNSISWVKREGRHKGCCKEDLRGFFPQTERIIFAEHFGADNAAKGEAGYAAECDRLRGFVFEPLRAYLADEWERAGLTKKQANEATGSQMAGHYFTRSQWALPTRAAYEKLREYARVHAKTNDHLRREYDHLRREYEDLRREYEDLRQEYEALRRPFFASADKPFTDVWDFPTVKPYRGKHVCEKPLPLMEHIITTSSRPGAVVLDCFAGSASTGVAAIRHGRQFIGIEKDPEWVRRGRERLDAEGHTLFSMAAE